MNTENYNNMKSNLTLKEIEDLCDLYMEGVLDPSEERDLATVISLAGYKSSKIEETLFLIGLSRIVANTDTQSSDQESFVKDSIKNNNGRFLRKALFKIIRTSAAAVIMILGVGAVWNSTYGLKEPEEYVYEVYIDGKLVTDPQLSMNLAMEAYQESERQISEMRHKKQLAMTQVRETLENVESLYTEMNLNLAK